VSAVLKKTVKGPCWILLFSPQVGRFGVSSRIWGETLSQPPNGTSLHQMALFDVRSSKSAELLELGALTRNEQNFEIKKLTEVLYFN
jgi:hypothetical protein